MGLVIIASNYLVQFQVNHYNLQELLTYGAFSYPVTFLITDLANRAFGKIVARKIVYIGFVIGIFLTLVLSTNFNDFISIRIAIGSGTAFIVAQLIDIQIFDKLRKNIWFVAPLVSSFVGSIIDTLLFFSISFYNTGIPACLWFLRREKANHSKEVLFIDASEMGFMKDRVHRDLADEDIDTITNTYHNWRKGNGYEDVKGYCKSATIEEIQKHKHVLTPGRYVGIPDEEDDGIPFEDKMAELSTTLKEQMEKEAELNQEIKDQLSNIGVNL